MTTSDTSLATVQSLPIMEVGIEYPLSTGPATFTAADFAQFLESQKDPAIKAPRLKLGHRSERCTSRNVWRTSLRHVPELHHGEDGMTLYADLVGIPGWFASVLPTAFPSRSFEGYYSTQPAPTAAGKQMESPHRCGCAPWSGHAWNLSPRRPRTAIRVDHAGRDGDHGDTHSRNRGSGQRRGSASQLLRHGCHRGSVLVVDARDVSRSQRRHRRERRRQPALQDRFHDFRRRRHHLGRSGRDQDPVRFPRRGHPAHHRC